MNGNRGSLARIRVALQIHLRPKPSSEKPKYNIDLMIASQTGLTKILADDLEDNGVLSLVDFMRSVSDKKFVRRGKRVEVTGLTNKKVKFFLRKFLHINRLSEYRVLDTTAALEIIRIKTEKADRKTKKSAPLKHPGPTGHPYRARSGQNSESNGKAGHL